MTTEPSPRPWHFNGMRPTIYSDEKLPDGSARVVLDIETDHLPLLPCDENDRRLIADLALIVDAVNHMDYDLSIRYELNDARAEIDRLRDIVRRLAEQLHDAVKLTPYDAIARDLLREARAAIGEDEK